jgi:phenylalanyl-tRNA synthetase beta chain
LIRDSPVYPLLLDKNGLVCSVPPIINSDHSKISIHTKNIFIDVTALNRPKAAICINNLIWAFSEYCGNKFEVEAVEIIDGEEKFLTPNIDHRYFTVNHKNA